VARWWERPLNREWAVGGTGGWTVPEVDEEATDNSDLDSESESVDEPCDGRWQGDIGQSFLKETVHHPSAFLKPTFKTMLQHELNLMKDIRTFFSQPNT
jgi:hypothetical protein